MCRKLRLHLQCNKMQRNNQFLGPKQLAQGLKKSPTRQRWLANLRPDGL